ncbi:GNAT family N-acetyltransferase, partial [Bacillus wiedmannii]
QTYIVQTGKENTPALSLYKKHGFIKINDIILPDGVVLTSLKKSEKTK